MHGKYVDVFLSIKQKKHEMYSIVDKKWSDLTS